MLGIVQNKPKLQCEHSPGSLPCMSTASRPAEGQTPVLWGPGGLPARSGAFRGLKARQNSYKQRRRKRILGPRVINSGTFCRGTWLSIAGRSMHKGREVDWVVGGA